MGLVGQILPRHISRVICVGVLDNDVTGLAHHTYHLPYIRPQAHPFKHPREDSKLPLESFRMRQNDEATIHIRKDTILCTALSKPSGPTAYSITIASQCLTTSSTMTLESVGDRGSPCVTPRRPLKGDP